MSIAPLPSPNLDTRHQVNSAQDLPQNAPIVIYTADELGRPLAKHCRETSLEVRAFLTQDRDAPETIDDVAVYPLQAAPSLADCNLLIACRGYQDVLPQLQRLGFRDIYVAHPFAQFLRASATTKHLLAPGQLYDKMVTSAPSPQHQVDIFAGDWMGRVPLFYVTSGWNDLYNDGRLLWADQQFAGGFRNRDVLELGPYEGLHSAMLERILGAASVTAVEANPRGFLRCLIVKNLLDLTRTRFLLGDFNEYLRTTSQRFDVIVASGVLYHMTKPLDLLQSLAARTDRLFIWTQYYDHERITANTMINFRFDPSRDRTNVMAGISCREYCFIYRDGSKPTDHLGGPDNHAYWLRLEDILTVLSALGFDRVTTTPPDQEHYFGPVISITAQRTKATA
jgi:hypothetical protein